MGIAELSYELAGRIKEKRLQLMLSQPEAAAQLGVSLRTFQNWERGRSFPQPRRRRALDEFLRESPE
jgi:DNA-binding transcriptional regulator YiaG